jgi:predicted GH43/DUF377 family glycosyl hydrolase
MPISRRDFLVAASALSAGTWRPASAPAAETCAGGWQKSPHNPILSLGNRGDFDQENIFAPCIVKEQGRYFLFYCGGPSGPRTKEEHVRYQLGLALSDDGEKFVKQGKPLLPLGERDDFHCTPAVLRNPDGTLHKRDGLWHMVYCANRPDDVEHATSRDGLAWEKDPRNPIYKKAYAPMLVQTENELRMYFVFKPPRRDGKAVPWEIHLASGPDFYSLRSHPANPMLQISQPWEKANLFYPYVIREGATWLMFYGAYWNGHPTARTSTAMGMATSPDGLRWTKCDANPILTQTPESKYDAIYTSSQSVIRDGDQYRLFYGGRIDMVHKYFSVNQATHVVPLISS